MTLYDFIQLPEEKQKELLPALKVLKPLPNYTRKRWLKKRTYGVKDSITELTFGEVNSVKRYVIKGTMDDLIEAFKIVYKCKARDIIRMDVIQFYRCMIFITTEVDKVIKMEQQHWNTEPTDYDIKLQQAGVKDLEQFGDLPMIDSLAGGDILRYNDIEKLNYLEVHYILWYRAIQTNIQNRFQKLMINK
ncbi:hypothetical protein [Capnocytophaga sputigena]